MSAVSRTESRASRTNASAASLVATAAGSFREPYILGQGHLGGVDVEPQRRSVSDVLAGFGEGPSVAVHAWLFGQFHDPHAVGVAVEHGRQGSWQAAICAPV